MKRRSFLGVVLGGAGQTLAAQFGWASLPGLGRPAVRSVDGEQLVERWSWAMGQAVHFRIFARDEATGLEAASLALAELRRVEAALSLFDPASDLVALNERAGIGRVRVGADLLEVLALTASFRRLTRGAFNPAVEPLMRAWGFHAARAEAPLPAELEAARRAVAGARIRLGSGSVALLSRDARLDLGGIGVGYGLDRAARVLSQAGIRRALLEVSGDFLALGSPPGQAGWKIAVTSPVEGEGPLGVVRLQEAALATSANTRSVVHYGALVAGHVLDPATGWPATAFTQVSVVARTAVEADALSTAMLVSGRRVPEVQEVIAAP